MKKVFPIILTPTEDGFVIYVPDLEINTQGDDLASGIDMARDAIGLWGICEEDVGREIPEPSTTAIDEIPHEVGEIVTLVDIDFRAYRKANDMRAVRKNVTLPSWLNEKAEKAHINFSQVLQEALKEKLGE